MSTTLFSQFILTGKPKLIRTSRQDKPGPTRRHHNLSQMDTKFTENLKHSHTHTLKFSGFAHAADPRIFLFFFGCFLLFFWVDFGVREVSQRRDLKILLQMGSGRARDDFKMPRSGTGTIMHFSKNHVLKIFCKNRSHLPPQAKLQGRKSLQVDYTFIDF